MEAKEPVPVNTKVPNIGIIKSKKYAMCSANGWVTAAIRRHVMSY